MNIRGGWKKDKFMNVKSNKINKRSQSTKNMYIKPLKNQTALSKEIIGYKH